MAVTLNALASVLVTSGEELFCARGLLIRSMLFLYSAVAGYRALGRSLDCSSMFEDMVDIVSLFEPWIW